MPCYEYHCDACGHDFEEMQRITDKPIRTCPRCKARRAHRVISRTTFVLKGTGWYTTDYARAGAREGSEGGTKDRAEGSSGEGSAESTGGDGEKAAAKAAPKPAGKKGAKRSQGSRAHA